MMVTRLAWMAQRLVSSKRPTMYASAASWSASTAEDWKRRSFLNSEAISRTSLWKGSLRMELSGLLEASDLTEGNGAGAEAVGLLDATSDGNLLGGLLVGNVLAGSLGASVLAGGVLGACPC